jgi:hypothetical protein
MVGERMEVRFTFRKIGWDSFTSHKPPKGPPDKSIKMFSAWTSRVSAKINFMWKKLWFSQFTSYSAVSYTFGNLSLSTWLILMFSKPKKVNKLIFIAVLSLKIIQSFQTSQRLFAFLTLLSFYNFQCQELIFYTLPNHFFGRWCYILD